MLHVKGDRVCRHRVSQSLRALQSSSPSYLLLASLDATTAQMRTQGRLLLDNCLQCAQFARSSLKHISGLDIFDITTTDHGNYTKDFTNWLDPLRLTVGFRQLSISGFEADDLLRAEYNVVAELPSLHTLTFVITPGVSKVDVHRMIEALKNIADRFTIELSMSSLLPKEPSIIPTDIHPSSDIWEGARVVSPRDAFFAPIEIVSCSDAIGRICAESMCPYPPGIPILFPGEQVTEKAMDSLKQALKAGATITGSADPSLSFISVCKLQGIP